jgi:hypothetical protein
LFCTVVHPSSSWWANRLAPDPALDETAAAAGAAAAPFPPLPAAAGAALDAETAGAAAGFAAVFEEEEGVEA